MWMQVSGGRLAGHAPETQSPVVMAWMGPRGGRDHVLSRKRQMSVVRVLAREGLRRHEEGGQVLRHPVVQLSGELVLDMPGVVRNAWFGQAQFNARRVACKLCFRNLNRAQCNETASPSITSGSMKRVWARGTAGNRTVG